VGTRERLGYTRRTWVIGVQGAWIWVQDKAEIRRYITHVASISNAVMRPKTGGMEAKNSGATGITPAGPVRMLQPAPVSAISVPAGMAPAASLPISWSMKNSPLPSVPMISILSKIPLNKASSSCCSPTYHCRKLNVE